MLKDNVGTRANGAEKISAENAKSVSNHPSNEVFLAAFWEEEEEE